MGSGITRFKDYWGILMDNKIPFYNIVNMFLIGLIFVGCCIFIYFDTFVKVLNSYAIPEINFITEAIITISFLAIIYEIGYIINRIGSIVTEPILIKLKAFPF